MDSQLPPPHSVVRLLLHLPVASDNQPSEPQRPHRHLRSARARLGDQPRLQLLHPLLGAVPASSVPVLRLPRLANPLNRQAALALLPPHRKVRTHLTISISNDSPMMPPFVTIKVPGEVLHLQPMRHFKKRTPLGRLRSPNTSKLSVPCRLIVIIRSRSAPHSTHIITRF